jgi:hypothetical protein
LRNTFMVNELAKKERFKTRKREFLARNRARLRKPQRATWACAKCQLPLWIAREILIEAGKRDVDKNVYIAELVELGLENSLGSQRLADTDDETMIITVRLGGELARRVIEKAKKRRWPIHAAIKELILWGVV